MRIASLLARVIAALAFAFLPGCGSLLGIAVGASIPRYETVEPAHAEAIPRGTDVEVEAWAPRSGEPSEYFTGQIVSVRGGHLFVDTPGDNHFHDVRLGRVRQLDAKTASYWPVGLAVGVLIDVAVVGLAVSAIQADQAKSPPLHLLY